MSRELLTFPNKMTTDKAENFIREQFVEDFETFDNYEVAKIFALALEQGLSGKETQLYTQYDSDTSNEVIYLKGKHVVNRTGVYMVMWK